MSDKNNVERIATAQVNVNVSNGNAALVSIELRNNSGFRTASRSTPGVYVLELRRSRDVNHLNVFATRLSTTPGDIAVFLLDDSHVQVSTFGTSFSGQLEPADSSFSIAVEHNHHD